MMEFRDLKAQYKKYKIEIDEAVGAMMASGLFIGGEVVTTLERRLAQYVGVQHCISCANGTEAMSLVLTAWGIGKGDAVFVPDFTFFSTAEVVSFVGATPIFVDVDEESFNIDVNKLEQAIQKVIEEGRLAPKVIIPVDLFGLPADHPAIRKIAEKYGLKILEDGAQGFGGSIDGKRACSFGDAATTSFFPAKPLGCYGDGGAIFTDDDVLAELLRSLKVHGKGVDKYDNVRIGVNSRLDALQAAILHIKLDAFVKHELDDVDRVAKKYDFLLRDLSIKLPKVPKGYRSSWAQYTIRLNSKEERDELQKNLKGKGIPSMIYYSKPMHQQGAFSHLGCVDEEFEVSDRLCDTVLSLPMHPYLTNDEIEQVARTIEQGISLRGK